MEEISVLGLVASTLASTKSQTQEEERLFEGVFMPRYAGWRGFFMSACLHIFVIFVVVPLTYILPESEEEAWRRHAQTLHALQLEIPDRLYFSPSEPAPPKPPAETQAKKEQLTPPKQLAKLESTPAPKAAELPRVPPRKFRLPEIRRRPFAQQTLIQPDLPPDLPLKADVRLPQLLLSAPVLPRPVPKRFVEPGPSAPPDVVRPQLEAPPKLADPSQAEEDLQIASMLTGPEEALLRIPRPTMRYRTFRPPSSGSSASSGRGTAISPTVGEPVNILAYSPNPAPLKDRVTIPLGNQIGHLPVLPPPDGSELPVGMPSAGGGTGGPNSGAGGMGNSPGGVGGGGPGGTGSGLGGAGGGPGGTGSGPGGAGVGGGNGGGDGIGVAMAAAKPAINYATPIRVEHPTNAVFDVVVVQSSVEEGFPESAGALSGRPVYTVYVKVGTPRDWLMQYCIPKGVEQGPKVVGSTVYIGRPTPLKAPFPLLTILPPVTMLPRTSYIMVHGFVDKGGQFKDLTVLRAPGDQIAHMLLPQLAQWQFRPATRDGVPVLVEILLAIPPHEG